MLIFLIALKSKFQQEVIANEPEQLFTMITKGQGQSQMTLPKGQKINLYFPGSSKILIFFQHCQKMRYGLISKP